MLRQIALCMLIGGALTATPAAAETLLLDSVDAARTTLSAPKRGMSMEAVQKSFGAPGNRRAAVGDPPITRWEYPGFIVYFEYNHVIHAVARRSGK